MVYSSVGYCACGREIWIEFIANGGAWSARYSDETHPELTYCPACGRRLDHEEMEAL